MEAESSQDSKTVAGTLTGRYRYRVAGWFRDRLLLQVEYRIIRYTQVLQPPPRPRAFVVETRWRDATLFDLEALISAGDIEL